MSEQPTPSQFPSAPLRELASRITDGSHFSPTPQEHGYLIANVKDMKSGFIDFSSCTRISTAAYRELNATGCTIRNGNVLLSKDGTVGRVVVYKQDEEIGALSSICIIVPTEEIDSAYLGHALQSQICVRQFENFMSGSALRRLVLRDIREIEIPVPSVEQQASIAQILDTLDTAIRETESLINKLKAIKQGLLRDLLTRGIDASGQLRPPQSEAPQLYKKTSLGWIPREWAVITLESVSSAVTSGSRDWARFYSDCGALFVRIGNLTREHINFRYDTVIRVQPPVNSDGQRTRLESGDILVSITADLGVIGVVPEGMGEAYINQHIALVRPSSSLVNSRFVGHYLAGSIMQTYISQLNDAGAKAGLNLPTIRKLPSVLPSRFEQDQIAAGLDEIDNRIQNAMTEAKKLSELKSGLMDDLLTGRVRVSPVLTSAQQTAAQTEA
jgi:type I restriction enzyme S subunit